MKLVLSACITDSCYSCDSLDSCAVRPNCLWYTKIEGCKENCRFYDGSENLCNTLPSCLWDALNAVCYELSDYCVGRTKVECLDRDDDCTWYGLDRKCYGHRCSWFSDSCDVCESEIACTKRTDCYWRFSSCYNLFCNESLGSECHTCTSFEACTGKFGCHWASDVCYNSSVVCGAGIESCSACATVAECSARIGCAWSIGECKLTTSGPNANDQNSTFLFFGSDCDKSGEQTICNKMSNCKWNKKRKICEIYQLKTASAMVIIILVFVSVLFVAFLTFAIFYCVVESTRHF